MFSRTGIRATCFPSWNASRILCLRSSFLLSWAKIVFSFLILLDRIKSGAQLIIVGDADQLPSVGAGNVLREMIRSEKVPTAVLETVFRQASNISSW